MSSAALWIMIPTLVIITWVTVYFFVKVLKAPQEPEPDSYSENDDEHR
jgi:hypothetical protein